MRYVYSICLILLLAACRDEEMPVSGIPEDGATVSVTLPVSVDAARQVVATRVVDDYAVNDLYLLAFNASGQKVYGYHYTAAELTAAPVDHTREQQVTATLPLGELTLYGVGNTRNEVYGDVAARLDVLDTEDELLALTLEVQADARNLSRVGATWLMAGTCNDGAPVTVTRQTTRLHHLVLRRLDASITFRFEAADRCTAFKARHWYCLNAPAKTYLIEHAAEGDTYGGWDAAETSDDFYSTREQLENYTIYDNTFTFYIPENRKTAPGTLTGYADRDRKGLAPELATAVVVNGTYEGTASSQTLGNDLPVSAEVTYTIRLGYARSVAKDFFCRRNTQYTYVVTVHGVDDIVVEVETDEERAPGATGEVVFLSGSQIYTLDAHYETVLLEFPVSELIRKRDETLAGNVEGRFECIVSTPYSEMEGCNAEKDKAWVSFVRNEANRQDALMPYAEAAALTGDRRLITVDELLDELWEYAEGQRTDDLIDGRLTYTCYVDEYYYEKDALPFDEVDRSLRTWDDPVNLWKSFVNTDDRRMYLVCNRQYSSDLESCIMSASYILSQRSIRTVYSTLPTPEEKVVAYGMETLNETGRLAWGSYTRSGQTLTWQTPSGAQTGSDNDNGWQNTRTLLGSTAWTTLVDETRNGYLNVAQNKEVTEEGTGLIGMQSSYAYAYAACAQRNRRTTASATLSDDDLHWYLAAINQYQNMYLGEAAMGDARLFRYPDGTGLTQTDVVSHFASSTFKTATADGCVVLWAEEGTSTSTLEEDLRWTAGGTDKDRKAQVAYRCVRNLGSSSSGTYTPLTRLSDDGTRITYTPLTETARNRTRIRHGELGTHSYQDMENQLAPAGFEIYPDLIGGSLRMQDVTGRVLSNGTWTTTSTSTTTACSTLTPSDGGAQWRAPNLREFTLMWQYGLLTGQEMSRTGFLYTYRNGWRNLSAGQNITMEDITYGTIRCVRDLE